MKMGKGRADINFLNVCHCRHFRRRRCDATLCNSLINSQFNSEINFLAHNFKMVRQTCGGVPAWFSTSKNGTSLWL